MSAFRRDVTEWQEKTFPRSTPESIMAHLREEIAELDGETGHYPYRLGMESGEFAVVANKHVAEEAADCYLLLIALAHRCGFDLETEARKKHTINKQRTWADCGRGYAKHVEPDDAK